MKMNVRTSQNMYEIRMEHGLLYHVSEIIQDAEHPFLVSDSGVPQQWRDALQKQYPDAHMHVIEQGERSKSIKVCSEILEDMLKHDVSRRDKIIALGGGVVTDIAGFAASIYMRGIRYINIPTTTLAQIDSSIGGKTAVDLAGVKNSIGSFWQPEMVLIDPDVLTTLSERHLHNGLIEAVKAGMIKDPALFELFENDDYMDHLEEIIERSLQVKKEIVEEDEKETGVRKLLNFGHTFGHAYESYYKLDQYYHGECVGMGMMTILNDENIRKRLQAVLERLKAPLNCAADADAVVSLIHNDKKTDHDTVQIVQVNEIGHAELQKWTMKEIEERAER